MVYITNVGGGTMDDHVREAIRYIGAILKCNEHADKAKLVEEAAQKYDLNPIQTEFVTNKFLLSR
jgi:hypothetical protein